MTADAPPDFTRLTADLDSPVFVVTTAAGGERAGCLVGFLTQASIHPARMLVCLSDKNRTTEVAAGATHLAVHFLGEGEADLALARRFGEETGDEVDKFAGLHCRPGPGGVPVLEGTKGWVVLRVVDRFPGGDHIAHLGEVESACHHHDGPSLTLPSARDLDPGHGA